MVFALAIWVLRLDKRLRRYAIKRLLWSLLIALAISVPFWALVTTAPGNPVDIIAGQHASEEVKQRVSVEYGLDQPWYMQYGDFMKGFVTGDWGESYRLRGESASELFDQRALISAPLGIITTIIVAFVGISFGLFLAWRQGTWLDTVFFVGAQLWVVIPSLIVIQIYILMFSIKLGILPAGWQGGWEGILTLSAVIPILTLSLPGIMGMAHFVRSVALQATRHSSVTAAKAKGFSTVQNLRKAVLPEVRLPIITALSPVMFTFFEGSFFVEYIYGIPGLAVFMLDSLFGRDYPVILNVGFLGICLGLLNYIVQDILYHTDRRVDIA
ncbi:MAG: ABC transporter permease [Candidatus Spechtbacterales bacterium]